MNRYNYDHIALLEARTISEKTKARQNPSMDLGRLSLNPTPLWGTICI